MKLLSLIRKTEKVVGIEEIHKAIDERLADGRLLEWAKKQLSK